ncbi:hypothetical protein DACRYDRAFT_104201 [Dacryopinax primogenitus]|uniref:F-box domain-containing protein n=1 Tax=Dacryopinax primogenitus (strain DJM 731) TaxID=1858805 RepID=M5G637_DACPD|nr:uncharacterized protein DACRYDRAFT_104201 [Dacryopinax primogenitus]EJU05716.1 hypothetical protein DACRYDRAFT_104201 [Dacryopinax primogenitus]
MEGRTDTETKADGLRHASSLIQREGSRPKALTPFASPTSHGLALRLRIAMMEIPQPALALHYSDGGSLLSTPPPHIGPATTPERFPEPEDKGVQMAQGYASASTETTSSPSNATITPHQDLSFKGSVTANGDDADMVDVVVDSAFEDEGLLEFLKRKEELALGYRRGGFAPLSCHDRFGPENHLAPRQHPARVKDFGAAHSQGSRVIDFLSSTTVLDMHHVWEIDELVRHILNQLDKQDLARATRVCRAFAQLTRPLLWEDPLWRQLQHLLQPDVDGNYPSKCFLRNKRYVKDIAVCLSSNSEDALAMTTDMILLRGWDPIPFSMLRSVNLTGSSCVHLVAVEYIVHAGLEQLSVEMTDETSRPSAFANTALMQQRAHYTLSFLKTLSTVAQNLKLLSWNCSGWIEDECPEVVHGLVETIRSLSHLETAVLTDICDLVLLHALSEQPKLKNLTVKGWSRSEATPFLALGDLVLSRLWKLESLTYRLVDDVPEPEDDLLFLFITVGRSFSRLENLSLNLLWSPSRVGGSALKQLTALPHLHYLECRVHATNDDEMNDALLAALVLNCPELEVVVLHWVHLQAVTMSEAAAWSTSIPCARLSLSSLQPFAKLIHLRQLSFHSVSPQFTAALDVTRPSDKPSYIPSGSEPRDGFLQLDIYLPRILDRGQILDLKSALMAQDTWHEVDEMQEGREVCDFLTALWPRKRVILRIHEGFSAIWMAAEQLLRREAADGMTK